MSTLFFLHPFLRVLKNLKNFKDIKFLLLDVLSAWVTGSTQLISSPFVNLLVS
jgi:hypothetical protein